MKKGGMKNDDVDDDDDLLCESSSTSKWLGDFGEGWRAHPLQPLLV